MNFHSIVQSAKLAVEGLDGLTRGIPHKNFANKIADNCNKKEEHFCERPNGGFAV